MVHDKPIPALITMGACATSERGAPCLAGEPNPQDARGMTEQQNRSSLLTCRECGGAMSRDAQTCPYCGRPVEPLGSSDHRYLLFVLIAVLVVALFFWIATWGSSWPIH